VGILILDGLSGAGKSFIARKVLQDVFGFYFYDADVNLPDSEIQAIKNGVLPTYSMRLEHINRIASATRILQTTYNNLVVTHAFMQNQYRNIFQEQIPQSVFILVECTLETRHRRLQARKNHVVTDNFAFMLDKDYEPPLIPHAIIRNDFDGTERITEQIKNILLSGSNTSV
jgi:gluconate kinase